MISYKNVHSNDKPQDIEITDTQVFLAKNIEEYSEVIEDHEVSGYKYDYFIYTKDEFLLESASQIEDLKEELAATKILLGVE